VFVLYWSVSVNGSHTNRIIIKCYRFALKYGRLIIRGSQHSLLIITETNVSFSLEKKVS